MEGGYLCEKDHADEEDPDVVLEEVLAIHETNTVPNQMAVSIHFEHAGVAIEAVMGALRLHDFDFLSVCIFSQILIKIPFNQIKLILVRALQARLESQLLGLFIQS